MKEAKKGFQGGRDHSLKAVDGVRTSGIVLVGSGFKSRFCFQLRLPANAHPRRQQGMALLTGSQQPLGMDNTDRIWPDPVNQ